MTPDEMARQRGDENERIALEAGRRLVARVPWLRSVEPASRDMDWRGADLVAESDAGRLLIQVKSSEARARAFRERNSWSGAKSRSLVPIPVVIVRRSFGPAENERCVLVALERARELAMERRQKRKAAARAVDEEDE